LDKLAGTENCGQSAGEGKRHDGGTVRDDDCILHDVKGIGLGIERFEGGSDILRSPDLQRGDFDAMRVGRGLDVPDLKRRIGKARVSHDGQPAQPGNGLTQQFEALAGDLGCLNRQSRDVAAGPRQTCDKAAADRVVPQYKDNWNDRCCLFGCKGSAVIRDDDSGFQANELGGDLSGVLRAAFRPTILDCDRATLAPSESRKRERSTAVPEMLELDARNLVFRRERPISVKHR